MIKNSAASDRVLEELKNRDMQDIFIACVDGLKGFPEALKPSIHMPLYNSVSCTWCVTALNYVGWNKRKEVAADLRLIYDAATIDE